MWSTQCIFSVSYEQAVEKVKMLRCAPAVYNRRRLFEQPIPDVQATNQFEVNVQLDVRSGQTRRNSLPIVLSHRPTVPNNADETDSVNRQQLENRSATDETATGNLGDMPSTTPITMSVENESNVAMNQNVVSINDSDAEMEVASTPPVTESIHHGSPQTSENVSQSETMSSVLVIATALANAVTVNASQQTFAKSKSVVSDSRVMDFENSDKSNEPVLTDTGYLNRSDVMQGGQSVFETPSNNPRITSQIEPADSSAEIAPGCSYWPDSEAIRQNRLNAFAAEQVHTELVEMNQAHNTLDNTSLDDNTPIDTNDNSECKFEMVPLRQTSNENANEIHSVLQIDTHRVESDPESDDDDVILVFADEIFFPRPMKATASSIIKRENDIISGNIGFNETVSICEFI